MCRVQMPAFKSPIKLDKVTVKYKGIFDQYGFLALIRKWIEDEGFDYHEKKYKHKVYDPQGDEVEIEIFGIDKKVTRYIKFRIDVLLHCWDVKNVEVIKEGKKQKLQKGRLELRMYGTVFLDYEERFEKTWVLRTFKNFMNTYILQHEILFKYAEPYYYDYLNFSKQLKEFLGMSATESAY